MFFLLIGSWVIAHIFGLLGPFGGVQCSLCTPGGARSRAKGLRVKGDMGRKGWQGQIGGVLERYQATFWGFLEGIYHAGYIPVYLLHISLDG